MRRFRLGELCVHRGFVCRVEGVTPSPKKGRNPDLTMLVLYGPDGKPVLKPSTRVAVSGAVETAADEIKRLTETIERAKTRIAQLSGRG